jgi:hypothetical protein
LLIDLSVKVTKESNKNVLNQKKSIEFTANTYPINFADMAGLPCRVVAEMK